MIFSLLSSLRNKEDIGAGEEESSWQIAERNRGEAGAAESAGAGRPLPHVEKSRPFPNRTAGLVLLKRTTFFSYRVV